MPHQCKKCRHLPFSTTERLKEHSRSHAQQCVVNLPLDGFGRYEVTTVRRSATETLRCPRCLKFQCMYPSKMQKHCKRCKLPNSMTVRPEPINTVAPGDPTQTLALLPRADIGSYIESELPFTIDRDLHVAICRICQYVVEFESLTLHAHRKHKVKVDPDKLSVDIDAFQLWLGAAGLAPYRAGTAAPKRPIGGLVVLDGYACRFCVFCCCRPGTMKVHLHHSHACGLSAQDSHRRCPVQRISPAPRNNSWFEVIHGHVENGVENPLVDVIAREAQQRRQVVRAASYAEVRNLPLFVKRLNWDRFMLGIDPADVVGMAGVISKPGPGDAHFFHTRLLEVCGALMEDFQSDNNDAADVLLRRKIKSTKDTDISRAPFSRLDRACRGYVAEMYHLIVLLLRSLDADKAGDDRVRILPVLLPLEDHLRQSLQTLWTGLGMEDAWGRFTAEHVASSKAHCSAVLEELFFVRRPSHRVCETSFLLYRFILFTAVQQHHVVSPGEVTHRISTMMYWCRSLVLHKIVHAPMSDVEDGGEIEGRYLSFVREDQRTPFTSMLEAKRLISAITKNEITLPKVVWSGNSQIVSGVPIHVEDISSVIHKSIKELENELRSDLLLDMPAYHLNRGRLLRSKRGGGLEDNLGDRSVGYSFVSNKNNYCSGYALDLLCHIVTDMALCHKFVERYDHVAGKITWRREVLHEWLRKVGKWLRKLITVVHLVAGQPARAVEFLSCTTQNTSPQIRGVYYVDGLVMLLSLYSKADNNRGAERPVARFLCKDTSSLLVAYLTYVRETEVVMSRVLYAEDRAALYGHLLAVKEGVAFNSRDLSQGISRIFLTHLGVRLSLNAWRHMAIAWMDRFLKNAKGLELARTGALDSQAGHTQSTASRVYGRSNFDHPNIGRDEFQLYRLASVEWHRVLRLVTDDIPDHLLPETNPSGTGVEPVPSARTVHHHHKMRVVRCAPNIGIGMDFVSPSCSRELLHALLALGYDKFKSQHQAQAIHQILRRREDLLVVLPTGGGKTLLFLLAAMMESGRYTTVVICPFVAMKKDMRDRLSKADLSVGVFSEFKSTGVVDILLVSVEHCQSKAFVNHLGFLHGDGRLGRIVVDECHLALTATCWRHPLLNLKYVRKMPVPLLLLSATVPPQMEDLLKHFFSNTHLSVIRGPTTRHNIAYRVIWVDGPLQDTLVDLLKEESPATPKSIVFSRGREQTTVLADFLCSKGLRATPYHAQMDARTKETSQDLWMSDDVDVMVATGAFGTGIDYGGVRLVVHLDEPYSMIDMVQESGRGGRDGSPSEHVLLLATSWHPKPDGCPRLAEFIAGSKCRRWVLQEFVDGSGSDCFSSGSRRCDVCDSMITCSRPIDVTTERARVTAGLDAGAYTVGGDDFDVLDDMDEDALVMLERPPPKKFSIGMAMLSQPASTTHERHTSRSSNLLDFARQLTDAKEKCILCVINQKWVHPHPLFQCPYTRGLCFKCLDGRHGAARCPNKLKWRGNKCFGCGLPNRLGGQELHPEDFGFGCKSIGDDKLSPACWYLWRNRKRFGGVLGGSGCPLHGSDLDFSKWLTDSSVEYDSNAVHLLALFWANPM